MARLRYAVARHEQECGTHYDLFLEQEGVCRTWRLAAPPESGDVAAEPIADHRIDYLTYEGEISGGRGRVVRHSAGFYRLNGALLTLVLGPSMGAYIFHDGRLISVRQLPAELIPKRS